MQLSVGVEMEAHGNQAAANFAAGLEKPSRKHQQHWQGPTEVT